MELLMTVNFGWLRVVFVFVCACLAQPLYAGNTYITFADNLGQGGVPTPDGDLVFTNHFLANGGQPVVGELATPVGTQQAGPIEFNIDVTGTLPQQSAYLTITAFDVDEDDPANPNFPEFNTVEFNGVPLGSAVATGFVTAANQPINKGSYLTGFNQSYSSSVFKLPLSSVVAGKNLVLIRPSQVKGSSWAVIVTTSQLVIDGGEGLQAQITKVNLLSSDPIPGTSFVSLQMQTSLKITQPGDYILEYSVIGPNGNSPVTARIPFTPSPNASLITRPIDRINFIYDQALVGDYTIHTQLFYVATGNAVTGTLLPVGVPFQQALTSLVFRPMDRDADGLKDVDEVTLGTNPDDADSDGDGIQDGDEVGNYPTNAAIDTDGDGIIDALESNILDDDGDTLSNQQDSDNADPCIPNPNSVACLALADDDGDGLSNSEEVALGTNPNLADSDGDGVDDATEVGAGYPTVAAIDTDGDGIIDALESKLTDTDGDGVNDQADPANNDTCIPDSTIGVCDADNDGLTNAEEALAGTNPNVSDSDGDGVNDGVEVGVNPASPTDTDGDGVIDALESDIADDDLDGFSNQQDNANLDPCLPNSTSKACLALLDTDGDGLNDQIDSANLDPCLPSIGNDACLKESTLDTAVFGAGSQNTLFLFFMVTLMLTRFWNASLKQDVSRYGKFL